ncbi:hypothetical protein ACLI4B_25640, partial [Pseudomonas aeruginosa]
MTESVLDYISRLGREARAASRLLAPAAPPTRLQGLHPPVPSHARAAR